MAKDFTQFGGWLKFFYVLFWINVILCGLAIPAEFYFRLSDDPDLAKYSNGVGFVESIAVGIAYWFIIRSIKIRTPEARGLIHRLAAFIVIAIFLLAGLQALLSGDPLWDAYDNPNHVLLPLAFAVYLAQSKRVQIYYQLAEEEKNAARLTREDSTAVAHGMVRMFSIVMLVVLGIMAFAGVLIYAAQ